VRIETVAVIGAGVMGSGIAQVLAVHGCRVRLYDIREEACVGAQLRIEGGRFGLRAGVERGKLSEEEAADALRRISAAPDLRAACLGADLVIEAVPEDIGLKLQVFRELDEATSSQAILASNTSGFPISALAAATLRPEWVLGWHWASPAPVMRFAEIVVHDRTDSEAIDTVVELAARCGKNPQVVRDQPLAWGFVANRIYLALLHEAERIVAEGVASTDQVDALLKDCFRWPAGPFEVLGAAGKGWEKSRAEVAETALAQRMTPFLRWIGNRANTEESEA
jgi:3-hydroxybutyryl-CoA dehydrogenase